MVKIGDLLINSKPYYNFLAPDFLRSEIRNHYPRLMKISGLTIEQVQEAEFQLYKDIVFISEEQIKISHWIIADALVADIVFHICSKADKLCCSSCGSSNVMRKGKINRKLKTVGIGLKPVYLR